MDRSEPMRIVLLIPNLESGGAERQAVLLSTGLRKRGHEVVLTCLRGNGALLDYAKANGLTVQDLGLNGIAHSLAALWRLHRLAGTGDVTLVYAMQPISNVMAAGLRALGWRGPIVWGVRSSDIPLHSYRFKTRLAYSLQRPLQQLCNAIICNSEVGRHHYLQLGFSAERLCTVSNGFDTELYRPDPAARSARRASFGLADDELAIGIVARLDPVKDHQSFLKAAQMFAARGHRVRFFIIGDGDAGYRTILHACADKLGLGEAVVWTGLLADMPAMYNALDIVTLCSVSEGFPNVIGEAMACGIACVSTDVGDAAALLGDTGLVVPARSPDVLIEAWSKLSDPARRHALGQVSRQRILDLFGIDTMVDRTIGVLRSVRRRIRSKGA
jgi:glycosyltransferase involved in cell wall biosynthesis